MDSLHVSRSLEPCVRLMPVTVNAFILLLFQGHARSSHSRTPLETSEMFIAFFMIEEQGP